jgi:DNA-binding transcriptional LysR family regulator
MIDSEWLRAFVAFGERLNFTRAAADLHLSQPALHVQIKKLGESLNVPLYVRRGRGVELTREGRKLLAFGREQAERQAAFVDSLRLGEGEETVVLAAGEGTLLYLLTDAIRRYQRSATARLLVLTRDREQALAAIELGEAHLAVTVTDEVPEGFVAKRVARVGPAVVLPRGHRLARRRALSIQDLSGEALVLPAQGRPLRSALARAFADAGLALRPGVEAHGWGLMMHFAELGLGLALVNDFCKPPPGMVLRPLRGLPSVQYQLLRLRDRKQGVATLALEKAILSLG